MMKQFIISTAALVSAVVALLQAPLAQANDLDSIQHIAKTITVELNSDYPGSGVIVSRVGSIYYVVTAKHVLEVDKIDSIITSDGQSHQLSECCIEKFDQIDLALVQFTSNLEYPTATLAYPQTGREQFVFISGFPAAGIDVSSYEWKVRSGTVITPEEALAFTDRPFSDGYELFYTNVAEPGMSGGPILDTDGRVIGIHGRSDGLRIYDGSLEQMRRLRIGISSGIPTQEFLRRTPSHLMASLSINDSSPSRFSVEEAEILQTHIFTSPVALSSQQDPISLINYSNSLYRIGRLREALITVDQAIYLDTTSPDAWYFKGIILTALDDHKSALSAYQQAISLAPDYLLAWRQQAITLTQLGEHTEALAAFDHVLRLQPQSYVNWYLRGELLQEHLNQPETAIESYRTALRLQPNFPQAVQDLLRTVQALQNPD